MKENGYRYYKTQDKMPILYRVRPDESNQFIVQSYTNNVWSSGFRAIHIPLFFTGITDDEAFLEMI